MCMIFSFSLDLHGQEIDTLSTPVDFNELAAMSVRHHNESLTKNDSISLNTFGNRIENYKNGEEYLAVHQEIIDLIKVERSTPFSLELAKLLIDDDKTVMNFLFEHLDIEKRNPQLIDANVDQLNILFEAFGSSYERRAIFLKHLIFGDIFENCDLESLYKLSHVWKSDDKMSLLERTSYLFSDDELFIAALDHVVEDSLRSECARTNASKLKSLVANLQKNR